MTLASGLDKIKGEIVDLSLTGAVMVIPESPDHTRPFKLIIEIPDGHVLTRTGELVRFDLRPTGDDSSDFYGVAGRFINVSVEDCFTLRGALRQLEAPARMMHEPSAATADMAALPAVLGSRTLRRTEQVRLRSESRGAPRWLPGGTTISPISLRRLAHNAGYYHVQ